MRVRRRRKTSTTERNKRMKKPHILYQNGQHTCLCFSDLVEGHGVQANQFMIINNNRAMLLDPGGDLTYIPLTLAIAQHIRLDQLSYIFASHQDPDIISAIDRWLINTNAQVLVSKLWGRFLPHLVSRHFDKQIGQIAERILEVDDAGSTVQLGEAELLIVPAHFLHSVGNFQLYDPVSKILFSGDMGASMVDDTSDPYVRDFAAHVPRMEKFHRRYMSCGKVTRLWARMVREMDVQMIVPQHGQAFKGRAMIDAFLDWASDLECGTDLLHQAHFKVPVRKKLRAVEAVV